MKTIPVTLFRTEEFIHFANQKFGRKVYDMYNYYGNITNFYENCTGNINELIVRRVERGDVTNLFDVVNYLIYKRFLEPGSYLIIN